MSKIAFISTIECAWGGSEALWSQTATRLAEDFNDVTVDVAIGSWGDREKLAQLETAGCRVHWLPKFRRPQRLFSHQKFRWLDAAQPDLVVISLAAHQHGVEWMQECQKRRLPYVLIIQSADESFAHTDDFVEKIRPGYEGAKTCFFVSQGNLDFVRTQMAALVLNADIVRNPFNVSYDASPAWPAPQVVDGEEWMHLGCVARLEPISKGQDILFQVLKQEKWQNRPLKVTLYGDGGNRRTLMKLKEIYGLRNVEFGGFVSSIEEVWSQCHALVLPSRFEGLPLSLVEAMLCGRPAIVTDVAGNAELIKDNVSGFVAQAPKPQLLDEALERAWHKRNDWKQMGQQAALDVRQAVSREPAADLAGKLHRLVTPSAN